MHQSKLIILLASIFLAACSSTPQNTPPQNSPSQLIQLDGYSISIPGGLRWHTAKRNPQSLHLVTKGKAPDETYAIQAWTLSLPDFESDEAFSTFMEKSIFKDSDSIRFIKREESVAAVETKHGVCIRFKSIHEDHSAVKKSENSDPMLLEAEGITCRNPDRQSTASHLVFSNRYYAGNRDTTLTEQAEELFSSLAFTK